MARQRTYTHITDTPMEVCLQERNDVFWFHPLQNITVRFAFVRDLLLESSEQRIGQRNLTSCLEALALLLSAVCTSALVKLDRINKSVDVANLGDGFGDSITSTVRHWTNKESDGEWVSVKRIPIDPVSKASSRAANGVRAAHFS